MKMLQNHKKLVIISAAVVVVAGLGGYLLYRHQAASTPVATAPHPINYGPPTQEEKDQAQAHKEALAQQNSTNTNSSTTSGKKQVTPIITSATQIGQQISINAYVSGIVEDGGTCTVTITQGGQTITRTSSGFANASTTNCTPVNMQRSDFPSAGDWQLTVSYSSGTASGNSQTKTMTVS